MIALEVLPIHSLSSTLDDAAENTVDAHNPANNNNNDIVEVGLYDILCGRDKAAFNNIGNRRFRVTVGLALARYMAAPSRKDKSVVIKSVKALVESNGGRFIQRTRRNNGWVVLTPKQAHEKVGHALRDAAMAKSNETAASSSQAIAQSKSLKRGGSSRVTPAPTVPEVRRPTSSNQYPVAERNETVSEVLASFQDTLPEPMPVNPKNTTTTTTATPMDSANNMYSPWEPKQQHGAARKSVDDNMLSWLVGESEFLLDNGNFESL